MSLRDAIDNFYERLVLDAIDATRAESDTANYLTNVMCLSLNRLPGRYYWHNNDMLFYLAEEALKEVKEKFLAEVRQATDYEPQHQKE